jgi:hypothetical protein
MSSVRSLLRLGNGKLGEAIHHFDLPAVATCPGRTAVCEQVCYANRGRFNTKSIRDRLAWNREQSSLPDFAPRLVEEIRRKGVLVLRLHVSGDFYSAEYADFWLTVMRACPQARYYFYTRSWRVPAIVPAIERMAGLANCRAWYSIDEETGIPTVIPSGVRLAYVQTSRQRPARADLVFRVRGLRKQPRLELPTVCPQETPAGHGQGINCGSCGVCFR